MKNKISIFLVIALVVVLFAGCGSAKAVAKKPVVPEPYTKMIENLKADDLEMASKYADLVIKDFTDSDYVYNAYLVKDMIILSKIYLNLYKFNLLGEGASQMSSMNSESDIKTVDRLHLTGQKN